MSRKRRTVRQISRRRVVTLAAAATVAFAGAAFLAACGAGGPAIAPRPSPATPVPTTATASPVATAIAAPVPTIRPAVTNVAPAIPTLAGCPAGMLCDPALGVAITLPAGWQQAPAGHYPPGQRVLWRTPSPGQVNPVERLVIAPWGPTTATNETQAAAVGMDRLLQETHMANAARVTVRYGGAPGVLVQGLPGGPSPVTAIVLAYDGVLYKILAPGNALAADQRQALESLRFMARVGPFPAANPPAPFTAPKEAAPVAQQALLWDAVAHATAQTIAPILQPATAPPGMATVPVLSAMPGAFSVEYRGPGKRLQIGVGKLNPPLPSGQSAPILVRGQHVSLALHDPVAPQTLDWLSWREPGHWQPYGDATVENVVEYFLFVQGMTPVAVQQVASSLVVLGS